MRRKHILAAIGAVAVAAGVAAIVILTPGGPVTPSSVSGLPNNALTPGAADPTKLTAAALCAPDYTTRTVRPSVQYTDSLKVKQIAQYGYTDVNPRDYEEDHLIALELGGDPTSPLNLWPEPRYGAHPASEKDRLENQLKRLVCSGKVQLTDAQHDIAFDWIAAEAKYAGQ